MGCATGVKPRKTVKSDGNIEANTQQQENKTMVGTMVRREMPEFEMDAYNAATGHYTTVKSSDYKTNGSGDTYTSCFFDYSIYLCLRQLQALGYGMLRVPLFIRLKYFLISICLILYLSKALF